MNNQQFLTTISQSFLKFLQTGSRSNEKLKMLHGDIAKDLSQKLGDNYLVKSLGFDDSKEGKIQGRYINKNVDITILKDNIPIAGIGVKFVMQNYAQNSNNYFENMLGETANIRSANIPYFQIFIIPETLPYYENNGNFKKWEYFNEHHIKKYNILSKDNDELFFHTPTKTLLYIIKLPTFDIEINHKSDYISYYNNYQNFNIEISNNLYENFGNGVIINDYETFINKIIHRILSI